jgi:hypothetical protein
VFVCIFVSCVTRLPLIIVSFDAAEKQKKQKQRAKKDKTSRVSYGWV